MYRLTQAQPEKGVGMKRQQTVVRMIGRLPGMKECVSATGRPGQTASEHCLRQWGMKPTVLTRRNPMDFNSSTLTHQSPLLRAVRPWGLVELMDTKQGRVNSLPE
jgi:hypothetical protein